MIIKYTEYIKENNLSSQFFKTYKETKEWLDNMEIQNYTINADLTIDVDGNVDISFNDLTYIPVKFGIVDGNFVCADNKLTTLEGSPKEVEYNFDCSDNKLTNLIGSPKQAKHYFECSINPLTSLDGLSIYNLTMNTIYYKWYNILNTKIKEDYFDKMLEDNPEIISLINFKPSKEFKTKWYHLFNANKFDLI